MCKQPINKERIDLSYFSLNIFYLCKKTKWIRHKLHILMTYSPIYNIKYILKNTYNTKEYIAINGRKLEH